MEELIEVIKMARRKKAPGPDGIQVEMFKELDEWGQGMQTKIRAPQRLVEK